MASVEALRAQFQQENQVADKAALLKRARRSKRFLPQEYWEAFHTVQIPEAEVRPSGIGENGGGVTLSGRDRIAGPRGNSRQGSE